MDYVNIPGVKVLVSRLGFGCASIMGRVGKRRSITALSHAYENGINYFDVARSYGFGDAERVVGEFCADKRDSVVIATKFGILPSRMSKTATIVKPFVRALTDVSGGLKKLVHKHSHRMLPRGYYNVSDATRSLENSLRELKTDYIDVLHIHECKASDELSDELLDFLDRSIQDGKIRTWGIASDISSIEVLSKRLGIAPPIIQYPSNAFVPVVPNRSIKSSFRIVHSPFGGANILSRLENRENSIRKRIDEWCKKNASSDECMDAFYKIQLLSAEYLSDSGIVITSMFNKSHIDSNLQVLKVKNYSHGQIQEFIGFIGDSYISD